MNYSIRDAFKSLDEIDDEIVGESSTKQVETSHKVKLSQSQIKLNENKKNVRQANRHLLENSFKLTDDDDVEDAKELLQDNEESEKDDVEVIVDVDAESKEELKDSYIGSIIIECPVCKTKIYKNKEDLVIDGQDDKEEKSLEDATVNVGEVCPHCKQEGGFVVIGKVAPINGGEASKEEPSESPETEPDSEETSQDDKEVDDNEENESEAITDDSEGEEKRQGFSLTDSGEDISEDMTLTHLEKLPNTQSLVEDTIDVDIKSIDTYSFNSLVEKYLCEVYDNIKTFTTTATQVLDDEGKIIIEGKITFKSGKTNNTKFIFEANEITKHKLIKFKGINETFSKSKRAFTLHAQLKESTLMSKHLTYDYLAKSLNESKSTKIYGRVSNIERIK